MSENANPGVWGHSGARLMPGCRDQAVSAGPERSEAARRILMILESPAWQSLGESNPSFQVENLTS